MTRKNKSDSSLRRIRLERGITATELSELTGFSSSYISRLEDGSRRLNEDTIRKLSEVLGCEPGDILQPAYKPGNVSQAHFYKLLGGRLYACTVEENIKIRAVLKKEE